MANRALIVDDDQSIVEIISEIVGDLFEFIDGANSVEEAESLLIKETYSLIFLDINLKNRNGAEVVKFLSDSPKNPNNKCPIFIVSGIISAIFAERFQNRFAGIIVKPFEHDLVKQMTEEILGIKKPASILEMPTDEISVSKCELPFPIVQLEARVEKILDNVKKSPRLKNLFAQMKVDRNQDAYLVNHVGILINIATAICVTLEWNTDKTLEKFVYAAYLHDIALAQRTDLARIAGMVELEKLEGTLSAQEYKFVLEHPNIAANTIAEFNDIPPDVEVMVRQHHELPKGDGFPAKLTHQKIAPLTAVFIISHDLTDYILNNPKYNINDYVAYANKKFHGSHFYKIIRILPDLK